MKKFLLFFLLFSASWPAAAAEHPFSVTRYGTGKQAVLFIPGFASSGTVWQETVDQLGSGYTAYVLTMAGFAGEKPSEDTPSFEARTKSIAAFIRDEKIDRPIIIGHSMGGAWALAVAAELPNGVRKVVVVDALPCLAAVSNPDFRADAQPDCSAMVQQMTAMPDALFKTMQQGTAASLCADTGKQKDIVNWSLASDRTTLAQLYCSFINTDLRARLAQVKAPVLILLQPSFQNISETVESQYAALPHHEVHYASKGLHFIMYDDKMWYLNELNRFIR